MNYLDTDVLIHAMLNQNSNLHLRVNDMIEEMTNASTFIISWLSIQEVGFVLAKLGHEATFITSKLNSLMASSPVGYGLFETQRATALAGTVGFRNFNDCIHFGNSGTTLQRYLYM
jgi:predicted nucleic acid-binding protein